MKKLLLTLTIITVSVILAHADLGILDNPKEVQAKTGASSIGITQIYDHPNQVSNGQFYVPITYNGNNGAESDPHFSNSDIDYVPLNQLKGANGATGAAGAIGAAGTAGTNGSKGDTGEAGTKGSQGDKGDKGDSGKPGDDGENRLNVNVGAEVRWYDWKHVALSSGYRYDLQHHGHVVDALVVQFKIGKSYEGRQMEKLRHDILDLQRQAAATFILR